VIVADVIHLVEMSNASLERT